VKLNARNFLLIDALGAMLSAFLLGVVLVEFENFFGMPFNVLCLLSLIACVFAGYSFIAYLRVKANAGRYLRIIAYANLAYCLLTLLLTIYFFFELSAFGSFYFLSEITVIVILAILEFRCASADQKPY
jgi:hypothetical protein